MDYCDSAKALRQLLADAGQLTYDQAMKFTWHSMKTTFIDQALVNAANPMDVGLQGHWRNPLGPMPVKYMRRRLDGPVRMVKEM
jgi:hypothetical protein